MKPPEPGVCQTLSDRTPSIAIASDAGTAETVRTVRGSGALGLIWTDAPGRPGGKAARKLSGVRVRAIKIRGRRQRFCMRQLIYQPDGQPVNLYEGLFSQELDGDALAGDLELGPPRIIPVARPDEGHGPAILLELIARVDGER